MEKEMGYSFEPDRVFRSAMGINENNQEKQQSG